MSKFLPYFWGAWLCVLAAWVARAPAPLVVRMEAVRTASATPVMLDFDRRSREFVLTNRGRVPVWYNGYARDMPQCFALRRTPDGWAETLGDRCGTGLNRWRLDPGRSARFAVDLKGRGTMGPDVRPLMTKYPDLWSYPAVLKVVIHRGDPKTRAEEVATGPIDPPPG